MTNTKWLSALLAGTALTVASTAAMADSSFLTLSRNAAGQGMTFSVAPTADMPASATEVTLSGEVRSLIKTTSTDGSDSSSDVSARGRVKAKGVTQTAVGEVGGSLRIGAGAVEDYTGYWKISDMLTLSGGKSDSLAAVGYSADWNATGGVWNGNAAGLTNPGVSFARLTMTSGPVTAAVGIETNTTGANGNYDTSTYNSNFTVTSYITSSNSPSIAGSLSYDGGAVTGQIVARAQSGHSSSDNEGSSISAHMLGAGVGFTSGMFTIEAAAVTGDGMAYDFTYLSNPGNDVSSYSEASFSAASVMAVMNVNETTRIEAFTGMAKVDSDDFADLDNDEVNTKITGYGAGLFYSPVSQLTLGLGASHTEKTKNGGDQTGSSTAGVGALFKF